MSRMWFTRTAAKGREKQTLYLCTGLLLLSIGYIVAAVLFWFRPPAHSSIHLPPANADSGLDNTSAVDMLSQMEAYSGQIAFRSDRDGGGVFVMSPDGSSVRRVDQQLYTLAREHEAFSPDKAWSAFWEPGAKYDTLAVRSLESGWINRLGIQEKVHSGPAWSPVDSRIAYMKKSAGAFEIHVVDSITLEDISLISGVQESEWISWSPDGEWIAFSADVGGKPQIGIIRVEDKTQEIISDGTSGDWAPVWVKSIESQDEQTERTAAEIFRLEYAIKACSEAGTATIEYLARTSQPGAFITRARADIDGVEIYDSGSVETTRLSDTLQFQVADVGNRRTDPHVMIRVWLYHDGKVTIEEGSLRLTCDTYAKLPMELLSYLPDNKDGGAETIRIQPTPIPLPELVGKILFLSDRDNDIAYYMMDSDGSNPLRVQEDPLVLEHARQAMQVNSTSTLLDAVVFSFFQDGDEDLYLFGRSNGWIAPLLNRPGMDIDPSWSPDSERIAFTGYENGDTEIMLFDRGNRSLVSLTQNPEYQDFHPSWSPNGRNIVFCSERDNLKKQIWTMDADGSEAQNISRNDFNDWDPIWIREPTNLSRTEYDYYFRAGEDDSQ